MEIGYEKQFDDLAIIVGDDYKYDHSIEVDAGFIVDVDENNEIVAIEVIDCSKKINKAKEYIQNAEINVSIKSYKYSYEITIDFNNGKEKIVRQVLK